MLDFVGNIERHGPITCVRPPRSAGSRGSGESHERTCQICPVCRMASELGTAECADCGHVFYREREVSHGTEAASNDIMAPPPEPEWLPVLGVTYGVNKGKDGKPDTLKVTYQCGMSERYSEWVCFDHPSGSFPRAKAEKWWQKRHGIEWVPKDVEMACKVAAEALKAPKAIRAIQEGKFWRVVAYDFSGIYSETTDRDDPGVGTGNTGAAIDAGEPIVF